MGCAREIKDLRVYKDCGAHSGMQQYVSVQECTQQQGREAGTNKTTRASQQWVVCRHAQEFRQHTRQYEQELESTQETIRNYAMQCSGRSLGALCWVTMSRAVSNAESGGIGHVVREGRPRFCVVGRQPLMKWQCLSSGMCLRTRHTVPGKLIEPENHFVFVE